MAERFHRNYYDNYKDRDYLFLNYKVLNKSVQQIAEENNASATTIYRWLERHGIKKKVQD